MKRVLLLLICAFTCMSGAAQIVGDDVTAAGLWEGFSFGETPTMREVVRFRESVAADIGKDKFQGLSNASIALVTAGRAYRQGMIADFDSDAAKQLLTAVDLRDPRIVDVPQSDWVVDNYYALGAILEGAPSDMAWGAMVFNTAYSTVGNRYDYDRYRQVLELGNDALTLHYLSRRLSDTFRYNGYTEGLERLRPYVDRYFPESEAKDVIVSRYVQYASTREGLQAPSFTMKDPQGRSYSLGDFRGKVLVVDIWATWCVSCIQKLPEFVATARKYAGRNDIEFITVTTDDRNVYNTWKYSLPKYDLLDFKNLFAEVTFKTDYMITGIPRYFVIDRDGKIVSLFAPGPGDDLEFMIGEALNK